MTAAGCSLPAMIPLSKTQICGIVDDIGDKAYCKITDPKEKESIGSIRHKFSAAGAEEKKSISVNVASDVAVGKFLMFSTDTLIAMVSEAVKAYPENPLVLNNYASLLLDSGKNTDSVRFLKKALEQDPDSPILLANIANAYLSLNDYGNAKGYAQKAISLAPEFGAPYQVMTSVHLKEGNDVLATETMVKGARNTFNDISIHQFDSFLSQAAKLKPGKEFPMKPFVLDELIKVCRDNVESGQSYNNADTPHGQIKIGDFPTFAGPDDFEKAGGYLMQQLKQIYDKTDFKLLLDSLDKSGGDGQKIVQRLMDEGFVPMDDLNLQGIDMNTINKAVELYQDDGQFGIGDALSLFGGNGKKQPSTLPVKLTGSGEIPIDLEIKQSYAFQVITAYYSYQLRTLDDDFSKKLDAFMEKFGEKSEEVNQRVNDRLNTTIKEIPGNVSAMIQGYKYFSSVNRQFKPITRGNYPAFIDLYQNHYNKTKQILEEYWLKSGGLLKYIPDRKLFDKMNKERERLVNDHIFYSLLGLAPMSLLMLGVDKMGLSDSELAELSQTDISIVDNPSPLVPKPKNCSPISSWPEPSGAREYGVGGGVFGFEVYGAYQDGKVKFELSTPLSQYTHEYDTQTGNYTTASLYGLRLALGSEGGVEASVGSLEGEYFTTDSQDRVVDRGSVKKIFSGIKILDAAGLSLGKDVKKSYITGITSSEKQKQLSYKFASVQ
jgi:tetratricopeptide (TPR) repeat protein